MNKKKKVNILDFVTMNKCMFETHMLTWVATFNKANLPFLETVKDIIGWSSWTLEYKQREKWKVRQSFQNSEPSDNQVEQLRTCFCLLGPRNCIHGFAGAYQKREQSGRRSYTRGTAHARLPTTPIGFRLDPVQARPTNH